MAERNKIEKGFDRIFFFFFSHFGQVSKKKKSNGSKKSCLSKGWIWGGRSDKNQHNCRQKGGGSCNKRNRKKYRIYMRTVLV